MNKFDDEIQAYWSYADMAEGELLKDISEEFQYISDEVQEILNRFQKIELSGMLSKKETETLHRKIKRWKENGYTDFYDMKLYLMDLERRKYIKAEEALFVWLFACIMGRYKSIAKITEKTYLKIAQHVYKQEFYIAQKITASKKVNLNEPKSISKILTETQPNGNNFYNGLYSNAEYQAKKLAETTASQKQQNKLLDVENPEYKKSLESQKNWLLRPSAASKGQPNNHAGYIDKNMTHVVGETVAQAFKDAGVKKYQFIATIDNRTTDACRSLHLKFFKLSSLQIGVNAPPIYPPPHPCRSIIIPVS